MHQSAGFRRWTISTVAALAIAVGGMGCARESAVAPSDGASSTTLTPMPYGEWTLAAVNGEAVEGAFAQGARLPSLRINADGTVTGFTGVNSLSTKADLEALAEGRLRLAPIITTKRAGPPAAMKIERDVLRALQDEGVLDVGQRSLTVKSPTGALELRR
jgi:heat shock protein HslJ